MEVPRFLKKTTITTKKQLMYYFGAMNFMFVYTVLAYSIAVFLTERFPNSENAIFMVGLILGMAAFFSLFVDSIWAYAQKAVHPRKLLLGAIVGVFITVGIFLGTNLWASSPLSWPFFTIIAAFSYGWSFNLYDVTMTTVVLNSAKKTELAQAMSQKKVAESIGMLFGMLIGGILIYFGSTVAQGFLMFFLTAIFLFFKTHFEKEEDEIALRFSQDSQVNWKQIFGSIADPEEVNKYLNAKYDTPQISDSNGNISSSEESQNLLYQKHHSERVKREISDGLKKKVSHISHAVAHEISDIPAHLQHSSRKGKKVLEEARLLLLDLLAKENEVVRSAVPKRNFHIKDMFNEIWIAFHLFKGIFSVSSRFALWWVSIVVIFFSFWDTMAVTFQPLFLEQFRDQLGIFTAFILPLFVLPLFFLQLPFAKLSDRYGAHIMVPIGVFISTLSLLVMGSLDSVFSSSITILILSGMANSIGYAAAFSPAQAKFVAEMRHHLVMNNLVPKNEEISAVLRLVLNIGNIFGQVLGGFLFAFIGFYGGFLLFGGLLFLLSIFAILFYPKLSLHEA